MPSVANYVPKRTNTTLQSWSGCSDLLWHSFQWDPEDRILYVWTLTTYAQSPGHTLCCWAGLFFLSRLLSVWTTSGALMLEFHEDRLQLWYYVYTMFSELWEYYTCPQKVHLSTVGRMSRCVCNFRAFACADRRPLRMQRAWNVANLHSLTRSDAPLCSKVLQLLPGWRFADGCDTESSRSMLQDISSKATFVRPIILWTLLVQSVHFTPSHHSLPASVDCQTTVYMSPLCSRWYQDNWCNIDSVCYFSWPGDCWTPSAMPLEQLLASQWLASTPVMEAAFSAVPTS